jgi:hypothetical protein
MFAKPLHKKIQMDITDDSAKLCDFAAVSARIFAYFIAKPAIAWTNGHIILVAAASYLRIPGPWILSETICPIVRGFTPVSVG